MHDLKHQFKDFNFDPYSLTFKRNYDLSTLLLSFFLSFVCQNDKIFVSEFHLSC